MDDKMTCERSVDLVSYLYAETSEPETQDIERHLRECRYCQAEAASFGQVRKSIVAWRDEALMGFVSSTVTVPTRKSALAAFRQFFDLSPLWLKGATAFAALAICTLAVLLFASARKETTGLAEAKKTYTEQEVKQLISDALASETLARQNTPPDKKTTEPKAPEQVVVANPPVRKKPVAKGRRPLSRAERDQLAADLRLLPPNDEIDLLGDRINEQR